MNIYRSLALAAATVAWLGATAASAQWVGSAEAPAAPKSEHAEALLLAPSKATRALRLEAIDPELIQSAKRANGASLAKRLQIGIGRDVGEVAAASSAALSWTPVAGGQAAQWQVTSPDAAALRIGLSAAQLDPGAELRFSGRATPEVVYGPFPAAQVAAMGAVYWSPVLDGDTAIV
jgi:hypothetical protein